MKKIILIASVFIVVNLNAQKSFEKKTNVIGFGLDLGVYNYVSTIGSSNSASTSRAANKMLSLQYERGILNWLGIGAKVQLSDYFTEKDAVTGAKPSVKAIDASILVNAHFIRSKHVDMLAGFNVGYSHLNWEARDANISAANGGGMALDFHIQPRFYFGNHVGMFINLAYVNYNYQNMDFTNTKSKINDILDLKGGGVNFGFGLQGKF
jgi:hypothetical protein